MGEVKADGELTEGWHDRSGCRNRVTWREREQSKADKAKSQMTKR